MQLKVIGTGSKGNAYLLENGEEALLIECGVNIKDIKAALDFNFKKLVGCIVTHEHGDHAKAVTDLMACGVNVHASEGTHAALKTTMHHRAGMLKMGPVYSFGGFSLKCFDVKHDAKQPFGFLVHHDETGNVLFLTDTMYCEYTFMDLNNIIIEANYDANIAKRKLGDMEFLRNRIITSHMSIDTCEKTLLANDLSKVNNIVLIHLSDSNSDANAFKDRISQATNKNVTVADNGLVMDFNIRPF